MDEDNDKLWSKIMAELRALDTIAKPYQKSGRQRRKSFFIFSQPDLGRREAPQPPPEDRVEDRGGRRVRSAVREQVAFRRVPRRDEEVAIAVGRRGSS